MIPGISNISFTSIYKVSNHDNSSTSFLDFGVLCDSLDSKNDSAAWFEETVSSKDLIWHKLFTLVVDDNKDDEVETYCLNHGIEFKKYSKNEVVPSIKEVKSRIKPPIDHFILVNVDGDKLANIAREQNFSFARNEIKYLEYNKTRVENMIKSGIEIPTSTLRIRNNRYYNMGQDTIEFAKNKPIKNVDFEFIRMTDEPDDGMFFAFRNMGMKHIPLYMDETTYKFADALGIITN